MHRWTALDPASLKPRRNRLPRRRQTKRERRSTDMNNTNSQKSGNANLVRVHNGETGEFNWIPAAELAPGMILVNFQGQGEAWVHCSELEQGKEYYHPPFNESIRQILRHIKSALQAVRPLSLEEWEDGFRRDMHPEREIAICVHIAKVYRHLTEGRNFPLARRQDIFRIIMACATSSRDCAEYTIEPRVLSRREAQEVIRAFYPQRA